MNNKEKYYWTRRDQECYDGVKGKTKEELVNLIEEYILDLSADLEPELAIFLLRKHLGIETDKVPGSTTKKDLLEGGTSLKEIFEPRLYDNR